MSNSYKFHVLSRSICFGLPVGGMSENYGTPKKHAFLTHANVLQDFDSFLILRTIK